MSLPNLEALWAEVRCHLEKIVIEELSLGLRGGGVYAYYLLATRWVLPNPHKRGLNACLLVEKVQDGNSDFLTLRSSSGHVAISLDLDDDYLHVSMHPSNRLFLSFTFKDSVGVPYSYQ